MYIKVVSFNMITSIDISSLFNKPIEPDNYFTLVLSSDFRTFEDCIKHCTKLTNSTDYGITLLITTKLEDTMELPTHKEVYVCDKGESDTLTLEWEQCDAAYTRHEVTFPNDWIEQYRVHENIRLTLHYQEDCTIEESEVILNAYELTKPPEFKLKELKL